MSPFVNPGAFLAKSTQRELYFVGHLSSFVTLQRGSVRLGIGFDGHNDAGLTENLPGCANVWGLGQERK